MKKIIKILTFPFVIILLSSAVLLGSTRILTSLPVSDKLYEITDFVDLNLFFHKSPEAQSNMQKKFSIYNHVDETQLTLFSLEQAEELYLHRENRNRTPLSYDEILFIINDSIQIYNQYERVILTNSNKYGITHHSSEDNAIIQCQPDSDMKNECIMSIIQYRIFMLDAGLTKKTIKSVSFSGRYGFEQSLLQDDELSDSITPDNDYTYFSDCYILLLNDNALFSSKELYAKSLEAEFSTAFGIYDKMDISHRYSKWNYPILFLNINNPFMPDIIICYEDTYTEYSIDELTK